MKPMLLLVLTVVLACGSLPAAAQAPSGKEIAKETLEANNWALQFGISNNFTLQTFQGAVISIKRQTSQRSAWRAGLGLSLDARSDDNAFASSRDDTVLFDDTRDGSSDAQSVQLNLQYLRYANTASRVALFLGVGTHGRFARSHSEITHPGDPVTRFVGQDYKSWAAGINGLMGVEWFASKAISIHAEYGVLAEYQWAKREIELAYSGAVTDAQFDGNEVSQWALHSSGLLFGLSVYF